MTRFVMTLALASSLALGCKSSTSAPPAPGSAATPAPAPAKPAPTPAADADRVEVLARHRSIASQEDLDADPVVVHFRRFRVTASRVDPQHVEGGTATLELDLASLESGSTERDEDLKSPAFIDVGKFATATIAVANVKAAGARYAADAAVSLRGTTKTYPITFDVLSATPTAVRVRGEVAFSRLDFHIGVDPAEDPTERVDTGLTIRYTLTIPRA